LGYPGPPVKSSGARVAGGPPLASALSRSAARIGGWIGSEEAASITPANAATARW